MTAPNPIVIYKLRIRVIGKRDDDGIRDLRQALRVLLRRFRLRCIAVERESIP
jgi:hypothetical protein